MEYDNIKNTKKDNSLKIEDPIKIKKNLFSRGLDWINKNPKETITFTVLGAGFLGAVGAIFSVGTIGLADALKKEALSLNEKTIKVRGLELDIPKTAFLNNNETGYFRTMRSEPGPLPMTLIDEKGKVTYIDLTQAATSVSRTGNCESKYYGFVENYSKDNIKQIVEDYLNEKTSYLVKEPEENISSNNGLCSETIKKSGIFNETITRNATIGEYLSNPWFGHFAYIIETKDNKVIKITEEYLSASKEDRYFAKKENKKRKVKKKSIKFI